MKGLVKNCNPWHRTLELGLLGLLSFALAGCGSGDEGFNAPNAVQKTIKKDTADSIVLEEGQSVSFPAASFDRNTVVTLSNFFAAGDADITRFPSATPESGDLFGSLVLNTPADAVFGADVSVTFRLAELASVASLTPGDEYIVWRFDFENGRWNQWGGTTATVQADGLSLVSTLPTDGAIGFIGSLAVFDGLEAGAAPVATEINGDVVALGGGGIATDVGIYALVGDIRVPVAISNGRVPDALDENGNAITVANTVDSAADGSFSMDIPEHLIGQQISLLFGHEDDAHQTQSEFDVLAPADLDDASVEYVENMVVRYGENNVLSRGVQ
ncbi:hypothetical protein IT575_15270 [bacterium]|nr:hypothetical protein [bacterium]